MRERSIAPPVFFLLAIATAAAAQDTPTYRAVRLEVRQEVIDRGASADLIGQVLSPELSCVADKDVTVYFDAADDVLMDETVATLKTDEGGSFYLSHAPATGGEYRAVVEEAGGCAASESNYTAIQMRADITLAAAPQSIEPGEAVRLRVGVDPFCVLLDELGVPVAELRIERLARSGWVALKRHPKPGAGYCRFELGVRPRRSTAYRAVGEGSFTALPRYENFFIGNQSLPLLVHVDDDQ